jgi:transposase-like protein
MRHELVSLSDALRELAQKRFRIIRPFLEEGVPLRVVAREHGIPYRSVQHWAMLYRRSGLTALSRRGHAAGSLPSRSLLPSNVVRPNPIDKVEIIARYRSLAGSPEGAMATN